PEGKLEVLGRRDAQVKISGFRIEIGEIENALLRLPGVRDCAVVATERADRSKRLVAFHSGERPRDAGVLGDELRASLPAYMIPSAIHWRENLPSTATGKSDREAFTAPPRAHDVAEQHHARPRPAPGTRRAAARGHGPRQPGGEDVGRGDQFCELGGRSLSAVRLAIALDRAVSLVDLAGHPILADLAALIDGRSKAVPSARERSAST